MTVEDFVYPHIEPTDYIDESRERILQRDDASKHGFRRVSTLPAVTEEDVGMEVYLVGVGKYKLVKRPEDEEPWWKQLTDDSRNAAYIDWVVENYQPISQLLTSLSKLTEAHDSIPYFRGPNDVQATPISYFMMDLLAQQDLESVRTGLSLGSAATLDVPIPGSAIADNSISISKVNSEFRKGVGFATGDCKFSIRSTAEDGWILLDDGSIGSAMSGATTRANADTYDLFMLAWNIPACTVQSFSGGKAEKTTAIADWSSNKRLVLPKVLGRALAGAGQGAGLSLRDLGSSTGTDTVQLTAEHIPPHKHGINVNTGSGHKGNYTDTTTGYLANGFTKYSNPWVASPNAVNWNLVTAEAVTGAGSSSSVDVHQPTTFMNVFMKL